MALIDRRNILELIGKHRGKYHSCILTCYNFDFSFFEERVLPILRTANVKNINIFADGHFLEQAQEMTTGREFLHNKTYNFTPVYEKGVFHPKIMLLTGVNHGLLIIGSGNITSSGISTNDEIWGAFHLDNINNENAPLFSDVWAYLQNYSKNTFGFGAQKMEWFKMYSPWIAELPKSNSVISLNTLSQQIQFICNGRNESLYEQILSSLPKRGLETLTVVSPYYDKQGNILQAFFKDLRPKNFNCIVDINSGLLPVSLDSTVQKHISFYNWEKCKNDYSSKYNRLHAKFFHFQYTDGTEYLFLGSANATTAAMGNQTLKGANAEAGILITRKKIKNNWLKELKIKIPSKSINLSTLPEVASLRPEAIRQMNYNYRILYSEIRNNEITCHLNKVPHDSSSLQIMSREGIVIETQVLSVDGNLATVKFNNAETIFKVCLVDANNNRLSNYSIVHRVEALLRCNPDPAQEKLDALMEQEFPNGDGITALLQFVNYDWADEDTGPAGTTKNPSVAKGSSSKSEKQEATFKKLPKEEFNKISSEIVLKQSGYLTTTNVRLVDFLNFVMSSESLKVTNFEESEEQKLFEDKEQVGEGEEVKTKSLNKISAEKEKRAIIKYFDRLDDLYYEMLLPFYDAKALTVFPSEKITIKAISKILIALQILHIYHGKKYTIANEDEGNNALIERKYLQDGNGSDNFESIKGFFSNVFGKFLVLATAGRKKYDYEIVNDKSESYYWQVFEKALFIIFNLNWKDEDDKRYRLTLLLNLHYFLNPNIPASQEWCAKISKRIKEIKKSSHYVSQYFDGNQAFYFQKFLPEYCDWSNTFNSEDKEFLIMDTNLLQQGAIIFNSKIGFNFLRRVFENGSIKVDLEREGYEFDGKIYTIQNLTYGTKCIKYL